MQVMQKEMLGTTANNRDREEVKKYKYTSGQGGDGPLPHSLLKGASPPSSPCSIMDIVAVRECSFELLYKNSCLNVKRHSNHAR